MTNWYEEWFNEDYLAHYAHRDDASAKQEVAALLQLLELPKGASILDLACGTGRHSIPLAAAGYDVTGVDLSETLLAEAEKRGSRVRFLRRDMRVLHDLGPFDAVFSFFTSFGYLDHEDQQVLNQVASVLKPGGLFFLDYLHPSEVRKSLREGVRLEDNHVVKTITFPHRTYTEKVRLYSREELEQMLEIAGLHVTAVYNDYDWNPWRLDGERQLFICKRT